MPDFDATSFAPHPSGVGEVDSEGGDTRDDDGTTSPGRVVGVAVEDGVTGGVGREGFVGLGLGFVLGVGAGAALIV